MHEMLVSGMAGAGNILMCLEHLTVPESKEIFKQKKKMDTYTPHTHHDECMIKGRSSQIRALNGQS